MIYTFHPYELDTARYELRDAGVPVAILPKTFELLTFLVQHHGQMVSKEELHRYLWPDQFVSESALVYHIAAARKAVGDSGRRQQVIKTVYGRGYMFIAPVEEHEMEPLAGSDTETPPEFVLANEDDEAGFVEQTVDRTDERRQLTVLSCSFVAASTSSSVLDPEDRHEGIRHAQSVCLEIIQQLGGHLAQHLSYGLLAYFGYPYAHEDDTHRAVRTGLRLLQAVRQLSQHYIRTHGMALTVRVALHSGIVIIEVAGGEGGSTPLALGEVPHLASALSSLADPNTVVLSAATLRLVEGYFLCDNLGDYFLEDLDQCIVLYKVLDESGAQSRIEAASAARLTPFIGREQELGLLQARWEQVQTGRGQVVLLSGDAGIGKSRLVHVFYEQLTELETSRIECRCASSTQRHAFYPIVEHFQRTASFDKADAPDDRWQKFAALREPLGLSPDEMTLLAVSLFALKPPGQQPMPALSPIQQQQKTCEALLTWLLHEAEQQPLCLVLEDLHWADVSTLNLLALLIEHVPTVRMLILLTFRSEFEPPWGAHSYMAPLVLSRLSNRQIDQIILEVTQGKPLPGEIVEQLQAKTDGVPLYVEEMTRMVLESGLVKEGDEAYALVDVLEPLTVPSTLHDSLMARLDGLGAGKRMAQLAAAIGREFSYDLIRAVADVDEPTLQQQLAQLVDVEILYQRGLLPRATFLFKHALIQESAYQSLLRTTRRQYHRQIAAVVEEQFPEMCESQPELLAYHYMEAGLPRAAVDYWQRAANQAFDRAAFLDAEAHVQQGLLAVARLVDVSERHQYELALQTRLAAVLRFIKGQCAPDVLHALQRAQELCEQVGNIPQSFNVIRSLWLSYIGQAQLATTYELAERLIKLARQQQDLALIMEAHRDMGASLFFLGEQTMAAQHFELSRRHISKESSPMLTILHGQGSEQSVLLSYQAWNQWLRGYSDQALGMMNHALHLALQLCQIQSIAIYQLHYFTLVSAATLHQWRREPDDVQPQVETSLALADQYGFSTHRPRALTLQGWVLVQRGQHEEGIALIQRGIADYRAPGLVLSCTHMLAMLAESYGAIGEIDKGLDAIAAALDLAHTYEERWWEAELYRVQAELRLQRDEPDVSQAAADLQQALTIARKQEVKSLELRAATSLARLLQQQGHVVQARELLTPVYGWFTEGFDTLDLQEANALLAELA